MGVKLDRRGTDPLCPLYNPFATAVSMPFLQSAAATWREADAAKIINELPDVPKSAIAATQSVRPLKEDSREGSNQGSGERVLLHA